jgi:hypothetical protein
MPKKKNLSLIGSAGVHYVCAELNMNGMIALPTVRNTKGMDVIVLTEDGDFLANVQVKTSSKKVSFWPISKNYKDWNGNNNYYVFVRYYDEKFEAFFESSDNVISQVHVKREQAKKRGAKEWAPCWYLPRRTSMPIQKLQWRMLSRFKKLMIKKNDNAG